MCRYSVVSVNGNKFTNVQSLHLLCCVISGQSVMQNLPSAVQILCETWNNIHTNEFPNIGSWVSVFLWFLLTVESIGPFSDSQQSNTRYFPPQRNAFANDTIPSESYISAIQAAHLGTLSNQSLPLASSLKHILLTLVRLSGDLIV